MWLNSFRKFILLFTILVVLSLVVPVASTQAATTLPSGFVSESVITNLTGPTTIAFAQDGRIFVGQKDGRVRIFQNGVLLPTDFIDISSRVNNYWDRGMLGIALHPDFPTTPYVYLLYTYDPPGVTDNGGGSRVSQLMRVSADPNNTNVALAGSEVILLGTNSTLANIGNTTNYSVPSCESGDVYVQDCIAMDSASHTIGTVMFGTDGSLFVSSGDGAGFNDVDPYAMRAQDLDSLNGKLLRINPITGQGYANNPFYDGNLNSNRSKVYSYGLRNPFRATVHPTTGEPFIGDVGWGGWEEINTGRGKNFGWPCYEGGNGTSEYQGGYGTHASTTADCMALYNQGSSAVQAPKYAYSHGGNSASVQVGGFYQGNTYPAQYQGALFFSDYNSDWIKYLTFDANGNATANQFGTDVSPTGNVVQVAVGNDSNLYYVAYNGPSLNTSEVRRIRYVAGGNTPPTANASADVTSGYTPLDVQFSSGGTFDPDNQTLTYSWNFGDGNSSTSPNPTHTYTSMGNFTATLTVTDTIGASSNDTVNITVGNLAPVATITSPVNGFGYSVNDTINFTGTGADNEDGALSGTSLEWFVLLHHGGHVHFDYAPGLTGTSGSFIVPDHGDDTWIELCLTVTDSGNLTDQECVDLNPEMVTLSFNSVPSGLQLQYAGTTYTTPFTVSASVGSTRTISAAATQDCNNFTSWSDAGAASHPIAVSTAQTFIATYSLCPLTITATAGQSKTYGNTDPTFAYISSVPSVVLTGALSRVSGENVGAYTLTQGTLASANPRYQITTFVPANFTINQKSASVTPAAKSKTYGTLDPTLTGTLSGFLPADGVSATYSRTPGETVGGYTISAGLSATGLLSNYNITYNTAILTINKATPTLAVTNSPVEFNGAPQTPVVTGSVSGVVSGVLVGGSTSQTNVGTYAVTANFVPTDTVNYNSLSNASAGNFVITADTMAPDTQLNSRPSSISTPDVIFTFSSPDPFATFECQLDGSAFSICVSPKSYSSLTSGSHTFSVRAKDPANNVDASPISYSWSVNGLPAVNMKSKVVSTSALSTQRGSSTGSLATLGLFEQVNVDDTPGTYLLLQTPGGLYDGYHSFYLPTDIEPMLISNMLLQVNLKAPAVTTQMWTWSVYDWELERWIDLGFSHNQTAGEWQTSIFTINLPRRFISQGNEVRIRLRSSNSNGDAQLDYAALHITYRPTTLVSPIPAPPTTPSKRPGTTSIPQPFR